MSLGNIYQAISGNVYQWFLVNGLKVVLILVATWIGLRVARIFIRRILITTITKTYEIRDLISGLFIILEDQYRKGDVIKISFDKEGIEIPFPYRTIVYKDQKK